MPAINVLIAPILQFLLLVGAVIQTAAADNVFTGQETIQIVVFAIGPAVTLLVPLAPGRWPGLLKTGLNALLGGLLVLADILANGGWQWSTNLVILIALGILNALAVELGVGVRQAQAARDAAEKDPLIEADPPATRAVLEAAERHMSN